MNILDIILLILLIVSAVSGYRKGIIVQVCGIAGLLLGIYIAFRFSTMLGQWLGAGAEFGPVLSFIILLIVVILVLWLAGKLIKKLFHATGLGIVDRIGGLALGVIKVALVLSLLLGLIQRFNDKHEIIKPQTFTSSKIYPPLRKMAGAIFPYIFDTTDKLLERSTGTSRNGTQQNHT